MADKLLLIADSQEIVNELGDIGQALSPKVFSVNGSISEEKIPDIFAEAESSDQGIVLANLGCLSLCSHFICMAFPCENVCLLNCSILIFCVET